MIICAGVNQLRVEMNFIARLPQASFENMRHSQSVCDFSHVSLAAVLHHACATDDFQLAELGQLREDVVLHAIDERGVGFVVAQVFKRKDCNP